MAKFTDKISNLIESQLPDFTLADHPKFVQFLKTYYLFMESAELIVSDINSSSGIQLETETNQQNYLIMNSSKVGTQRTLLDADDKILLEDSAYGKFTRGETITGQTSKATAVILTEDLDSNRLFISAQDKFSIGELVVGSTSNATAIISKYRPNPVTNIQELLNFRDPDNVISDFLTNFREEFLNTVPDNLFDNVDKRKLIKNIKSLYQLKGTKGGHNIFFRLLFNEISDTIYPRENLLRVSDGKFTTNKVLRAIGSAGETTNLTGRTITGQTSNATAIVESVSKFIIASSEISEFILNDDSINGTFQIGEEIRGTASDTDDLLIKADVTGIPISKSISQPGSLHSINEATTVTGGGSGAIIQTGNIGSGGVTEVVIDNAGTGYAVGEDLVFDNTNTNGAGVAGFISVVNGGFTQESGTTGTTGEDHIVLEDETQRGDIYSGNKIVMEPDTNSNLNDITDVFLFNKGSGYTSLPTVTINTSSGTSGVLKLFSTEIGRVLDLNIVELGFAHQLSPTPPTVTLFKNFIMVSASGNFTAGESITTSASATGTIVSWDSTRGLLVLKDTSGTFSEDDVITGSSSGVTANIAKFSASSASLVIGAVADTDGTFVNEDGFLSESTKRVQDSLYYQDFSYVLQVARSISDWRDDFKTTMHTAGFYFAGQVNVELSANAQIKSPVVGEISGAVDDPIFSSLKYLFLTLLGRRLGTVDDGTSLRSNPKVGTTETPGDTPPIDHFPSNTRDVTLRRPAINIEYVSRKRRTINGNLVKIGHVYAGPRYGTINREALKAFKINGTNYSIFELSKNVTFGTKTALDGNDNTLLLCSNADGRGVKTKLTMPCEFAIITPKNQFSNTLTTFDATIDNDSSAITFDDTTP